MLALKKRGRQSRRTNLGAMDRFIVEIYGLSSEITELSQMEGVDIDIIEGTGTGFFG